MLINQAEEPHQFLALLYEYYVLYFLSIEKKLSEMLWIFEIGKALLAVGLRIRVHLQRGHR